MGINVCAEATTFGSVAGGFVRIDVAELAHAWHACRARTLGIAAFRAWLALREMVARRQPTAGRAAPTYGIAELATLLDVAPRTAIAAVDRLVAAGFLARSDSAITILTPTDRQHPGDSLADTIGGGQGTVSVPRRMLRFLARGARTALIATALGALLRCVARRRAGFSALGRFKASWIARTFAIAARHAKAARTELIALGWLEPRPGDQWAWNRWGRAYRIRLDWSGPGADRHPCPAPNARQSSPPDLHPDPFQEEEHPEPAPSGPTGASLFVSGSPGLESTPEPAINHTADSSLPAPDLHNIRVEDLADTGRALELHQQAVKQGRITASEADRVRFVAATEHARAVGRRNPCGLLARIVRLGWWHLVTQGDEDRAARRLREHGRPPARSWRHEVEIASPAMRPAAAPGLRPPFVPGCPARSPSALSDLLDRFAHRPLP